MADKLKNQNNEHMRSLGEVRFVSFFPKWKKTDDFYFTVSNILSIAQNFKQLHYFDYWLENKMVNTYGIILLTSSWHFSVKQMTFLIKC